MWYVTAFKFQLLSCEDSDRKGSGKQKTDELVLKHGLSMQNPGAQSVLLWHGLNHLLSFDL